MLGRRVEIVRCVTAALVAAAWLWFVSHGFQLDGVLDAYYELQAQGLLQARLSIGPGPFDLFIHDVSIRGGQCYSVYGMFPSALFILAKPLLGRLLAHYLIVFVFFFALALFFQKLIGEVIEAAGAFESEPPTLVHLAGILLGCLLLFLVPLPGLDNWFFNRFLIYEQQVLFSLALAMPGTYYLVRAIRTHRRDLFATAALLFSLAAWTKITWFPFAIICAAAGLCLACLSGWSPKAGLGRIMMTLELSLCVVLLPGRLVLNWAQFGSPLDFGVFLMDPFMNPTEGDYLRILMPFFSPLTRLGNAAFTMLSFYGSPKAATVSLVWDHSFTFWEGMAPCFFATNPWFLLLAALVPAGLLLSRRKRPAMFRVMLVVLGVVVYMNCVIAVFGFVITKRYFMESYYFLIVLLFATLLVFIRLRYAVVLLLLCVGIQARTTIAAFGSVKPDLRVIDVQENYRITSPSGSAPFIVRNGNWPHEFLSGANLRHASRCAVTGFHPHGGGEISAMDVSAVYLSPEPAPVQESPARVLIHGASSVSGGGTWLIFVDEKMVGSVAFEGKTSVDGAFDVPFPLRRGVPYRVLGVFLPDHAIYLPARPPEEPVITLRGIELEPMAEADSRNRRALH
jgi:hypothetical protein